MVVDVAAVALMVGTGLVLRAHFTLSRPQFVTGIVLTSFAFFVFWALAFVVT
jgi:hypothetical protein